MERIYSPPQLQRRARNFSRVTDLEDSQQWTSLASDINDFERANMRQHVISDPRKHVLHRRSMPEPQHTSLIYVDVNTDNYGTGSLRNKSIADHYFLPIGSETVDASVDSWCWRPANDNTPEKRYFGNNKYENYNYNGPDESRVVNNQPTINQMRKNERNTYNENSYQLQRNGNDGEILRDGNEGRNLTKKEKSFYNNERFDTEETAYRGSREKLHEIFRRNRDLRREFFATVPKSISSEPTSKSWTNASPVFKDRSHNRVEIPQETGSGYGSVETLTSQSNNSEISSIHNRRTENSSRASVNSRTSEAPENLGKIVPDLMLENKRNSTTYDTLVNQTSASARDFRRSIDLKKDEHCNSLPGLLKNQSLVKPLNLDLTSYGNNRSKSVESPDFYDIQSPVPPLPSSQPPSSISGHRLVISGESSTAPGPLSIISNPPDPPKRQSSEKKNSEAPAFLARDSQSQSAYKPDSEGLKMLDRFEACIENRKSSPLTLPDSSQSRNSNVPDDSSVSKNIYTSMPELTRAGRMLGNPGRGVISRLAVNGSTVDLNLTDNDYYGEKFGRNFNNDDESEFGNSEGRSSQKFDVIEAQPTLKYVEELQEIHATRVDLLKKSKLSNRRQRIPPPLDLSKVTEALRQESIRHDRRILRDYSVERIPLQGELVKCKVTVRDGSLKDFGANTSSNRPQVETALKTATNLLNLSRNLSRPVVPVRGTSGNEKNTRVQDRNENQHPGDGLARYRSSVVVWCDGNNEDDQNSALQQRSESIARRRSTPEHRKSTGSLISSAGNVFSSVYAPIPYKSPRRYVEGEVTIHYRSPVRTEAKEILSEAELARRSAENMRRVYQEERRRKYLQELHDIDSRRHTDNFTPSQKSPIPLNRYDDFMDDLSHRSRSQEQTPEPRLVAKALYNFVGQSSRELTFRRGDIIFVRRQVDKNWYEGEHNAMIGLFPFNYVEILPYDGIRTTSTPKKPYEGQARAKFNFVAQTTHELSLVKGDLVVLTRRVDENWYEGRIGNRKGIFPISYVEVLVEPGVRPETPAQNKPVAAPAAHSLLSNGSAGGKLSMGPHHYTPSIPTHTNSAQPHYNSLPRMGASKLHVAPVNETLHIDTHSEPLRYRSLYNYRPQNDDELELKEGDTVYVMEKCDDGWFVGSSQRTGCFGTFPGNYVERL